MLTAVLFIIGKKWQRKEDLQSPGGRKPHPTVLEGDHGAGHGMWGGRREKRGTARQGPSTARPHKPCSGLTLTYNNGAPLKCFKQGTNISLVLLQSLLWLSQKRDCTEMNLQARRPDRRDSQCSNEKGWRLYSGNEDKQTDFRETRIWTWEGPTRAVRKGEPRPPPRFPASILNRVLEEAESLKKKRVQFYTY